MNIKTILIGLLITVVSQQLLAEFDFKYPRTTVEMKLQKVSEHVYFVQGIAGIATDNQGFISNATAIIANDGVVIVDALGSPSLAEKFLSELRKITQLPITKVITTHYHADHIYGLQTFTETGAKLYAPEGVNQYLDSEAATSRLEERRFSLEPWVNENTKLQFPDVIISESQQIKQGDITLTINYLGKAHSDGDLTVFVEQDGVFISGDVIFEGRIPFVGDADSKAWLETLNKMGKQDNIKALIPGHGSLAEDPESAITLTRNYLTFLRKHFAAGVEEMMTFDEIYSEIDWKDFEHLPAFDFGNRTNAYQLFLNLEQELLEN